MAYYLPQSSENLLRISGVGETKLAQFGDQFLSVIRSHASQNGLPEKSNPTVRAPGHSRRQAGSTLDVTRRLLSQGRSLDEIAAERGLTLTTIIGHAEALIDAGDELELDHIMPSPDRTVEIRSAFEAAGTPMLSPVRELLGEGYSYEELRLVRLDLRRQNAQPTDAGKDR
jgi:ATP-dependent DNA helicase RecQ